jgi:hypothetical protein
MTLESEKAPNRRTLDCRKIWMKERGHCREFTKADPKRSSLSYKAYLYGCYTIADLEGCDGKGLPSTAP